MVIPSAGPGERCIGLAITVPEPWASLLRDARLSFGDPGANLIPPHVTLIPPTLVPADDDGAIGALVRAALALVAPFGLRLRGTASFRPVSPVVFVEVVEGASECAALYEAVHTGLMERERPFCFVPHVTVAQEVADSLLDQAQEDLAGFDAAFVANEVDLYAQEESGAWHLVERFALGTGLASR
ncbi:MAG: 2'-5' RNA ligase family protein [Micrococcales bacterium]|nr:2'-5' RNA ligase family protein [Micrococcales bacterium]